jgi:hypothetical protein
MGYMNIGRREGADGSTYRDGVFKPWSVLRSRLRGGGLLLLVDGQPEPYTSLLPRIA